PATAVSTMRECVDLFRDSGMPRMEMAAYLGLARLEIATGHYRPAVDLLQDTTRWYFDAGDFYSLTASLALVSAVLMHCDLPEPPPSSPPRHSRWPPSPSLRPPSSNAPRPSGTRTSTVSANRGDPRHAPKWPSTPSRPSKRPKPGSISHLIASGHKQWR